ncbi:MAG: integration host factor [Deltaproteobacteria bacterium HGW-Deltaproteobacteria-14]|jgi:DNA-binding protein HU-beta|nr:MAG: integration host factor [Deltaproteobacteria bacterium HGW-Deltaproteobacteria-14]
MTKAELIDQVHGKLDGKLNKKETGAAVQAVFDALGAGIQRDGRIAYPDFGTFTVKTRAARQGRNPRTGEALTIAESKSVNFKPAPQFKDAL